MRTRRMTPLLAAASLVVALAGCSDDKGDEPGADPTPAASDSAGTTSPTDGSSTADAPEVQPATGQLITLKSTATFHLLADVKWRLFGDKSISVAIATEDLPPGADDFVYINAGEFPQIDDDLSRIAQVALKSEQKDHDIPLEIGSPRTIAGVEGYVLQGKGPGGQYYEWGGLDADNVLTTLGFVVPDGLDVKEWVEPVLASLQWQ